MSDENLFCCFGFFIGSGLKGSLAVKSGVSFYLFAHF